MKKTVIFITILTGLCFFSLWLCLPEKNEKPQFGRDKPEGFTQYMRYITGTPDGNSKLYKLNYRLKEFNKALNNTQYLKSTKAKLNWKERGPGNVGGRTRALVIDPTDTTNSTWFAAAVSGGIWKTTDMGKTWEDLTSDIPVLSTACLVMSKSNPDILYAGTGEGFGGYGMVIGNGIYKSTQHGAAGTWKALPSTQFNDNFEYINRIVVDYDSPDTVLACTNTGIFKSVNGGNSWSKVYELSGHRVQHILADPVDFNILYAGVNGYGIVKSTDKGDTWLAVNEGIGEAKRFELAVSEVNPNKIFASVEGFSNQTVIYYSYNQGESWHCFKEKDGNSFNFLRNQGWFDNTIMCHPYDENIVFIAGVYLGKIELSNTTEESDPQVLRVDTVGTGAMLDFVSFGGRYFNGAMAIGSDEEGEEIEDDNWCSVEIRLGSKYKQKAHRFVVPEGSGAGVLPENYSYASYVDVPFEVWDTDNNRQLMVSFRDNERDGAFNIIEYDEDVPSEGREYFFIHGITYDQNAPDLNITKDAGYTYKLLYFFWPTLQTDSVYNPEKLDGMIKVKYGKFIYQKGTATMLADDNKNSGLHVDHHQLIPVKKDIVNKTFRIINTNDGGLGISEDGGNTWKQICEGYNTTQFYGVAKKPGYNEYIGGMQDNGTWQSKKGESANKTTEYEDRLEGDGFETLWHPDYPQRIIGSTYNNYFSVTNDGGETWEYVYDGINGDGPFVSRLSHSLDNPNTVFAVGGQGVYRHFNFALGRQSWELTLLYDSFSINRYAYTHDVEVSLAHPAVVWAGTGMYADPELRIFVSTDGGESYKTTSLYKKERLGFITSIATHPILPKTAFVMFSQPEQPKILRTDDLGQTWVDISGFGDNDTSSNGFPDVIVYTLLVHPEDTSVLWAGTEIGLFESVNSGKTWQYADNGLPAVSIFQLKEIDGQIIAGTHGRGIWTLNLSGTGIDSPQSLHEINWKVYPNPASDYLNIEISEDVINKGNIVNILGMDGRIRYTTEYHDQKVRIPLNSLPKGNYIVQIKINNKSYQKKFIKE